MEHNTDNNIDKINTRHIILQNALDQADLLDDWVFSKAFEVLSGFNSENNAGV